MFKVYLHDVDVQVDEDRMMTFDGKPLHKYFCGKKVSPRRTILGVGGTKIARQNGCSKCQAPCVYRSGYFYDLHCYRILGLSNMLVGLRFICDIDYIPKFMFVEFIFCV